MEAVPIGGCGGHAPIVVVGEVVVVAAALAEIILFAVAVTLTAVGGSCGVGVPEDDVAKEVHGGWFAI